MRKCPDIAQGLLNHELNVLYIAMNIVHCIRIISYDKDKTLSVAQVCQQYFPHTKHIMEYR